MMSKEMADEVFNLAREYCSKLNESLAKVQDTCSHEDFDWYRTAVARVMACSQDHIMEPLIKQHPELEPEAWKD